MLECGDDTDLDAFRSHPVPSKSVFLIRGLPGSGKSTLANQLADLLGTADWYEADDYFIQFDGSYRFLPRLLGLAHDRCQQLFLNACKEQSPHIIVSNTFTTNNEMEFYLETAKTYGYRTTVIHCEGNYGSIHNVPEETIAKMKARWESYAP